MLAKVSGHQYRIEALELRRLLSGDLPPIAPDRFEPNNSFAQATDFGVQGYRVENDLTVHVANDDDYFKFTPEISGFATINITFDHTQGDLDLLLYDNGSPHTIIGHSTSTNNNFETINHFVNVGETYFILVTEANSGTSPDYDLTLDSPSHPAVTNSAFDFQSSHNLVFAFNKDVSASLAPSDVSVVNGVGNPVPGPASVSYDGGTNTGTFGFSSILADGNYVATLSGAGVEDDSGNTMTADVTLPFFVFTGDADHNRTVDTVDFNILASNFSKTGKTFGQGDFNYDHSVDTIDFNLLAANFSKTLAPASSSTVKNPVAQRLAPDSSFALPQDKNVDDSQVVGIIPAVD